MAGPAQTPINEIGAAQGAPIYLGTVDATTTAKTNAEATTPFSATGDALGGKVLLLHNAGADDVRIHPVALSTGDVTVTRNAASFGVLLAAGTKGTLRMQSGLPFLSVIALASTSSVDFWELT